MASMLSYEYPFDQYNHVRNEKQILIEYYF